MRGGDGRDGGSGVAAGLAMTPRLVDLDLDAPNPGNGRDGEQGGRGRRGRGGGRFL